MTYAMPDGQPLAKRRDDELERLRRELDPGKS
jgi:hypothetical protein